MYRRSLLPLFGAIALAVLAIFSATAGGLGLNTSPIAASGALSVDDWSLRTNHDGQLVVDSVTVSGVPEQAVGHAVTVYFQGSETHQAQGQIIAPGTVQIPLADQHVAAADVHTVSLVLEG